MSFKRYLNISLFANVSNVLRIKLINLSTAEAVLRPIYYVLLAHLSHDQLVYCGSGIETLTKPPLTRSIVDQLVYCGSGIETHRNSFQLR